MSKRDRSEHTAIHEAGHAVAIVVLSLHITDATVVRDGRVLGSVGHPNLMFGYNDASKRGRQSRVRDAIVVAYAGRAAEHVLCGEPLTFDDDTGSGDDRRSAWDLLKQCRVRNCSHIGDDVFCAALNRYLRQAVRLVRQHETAIRRVAAVLRKRRNLTSDEIRALVRR